MSVADTEQNPRRRAVIELTSIQTPVDGGGHERIAVRSYWGIRAVGACRILVVWHQVVAEHRCKRSHFLFHFPTFSSL